MSPLVDTPDTDTESQDVADVAPLDAVSGGNVGSGAGSEAGSEAGGDDAASEVDAILGQLHDGLQKAEATMASILERIVADNAHVLAELEDALSDMEAALTNE